MQLQYILQRSQASFASLLPLVPSHKTRLCSNHTRETDIMTIKILTISITTRILPVAL